MVKRRCEVWALALVSSLLVVLIGFATSKDYGDVTISGGFMAGNFSDVWDLTKGDMYILVRIDLRGVSDAAGAHAWSEIGIRDTSTTSNFNPGAWITGGKGVWVATDYDWTPGTFNPDPPGSPTLDMDDKLQLQRGGGADEGYYDLPSSPAQYWNNYGFWFDRDGVDPWQALMWGAVNGGTYNTGGIYYVVIRLRALSDTQGVAYMTVNGIQQGFYNGPWYNGQPTLYPAGLTFTGDMKNMQVFYGLYGYGTTHVVQFGDIAVVLTDVVWVDDDWAGKAVGEKVDGHYYGYDAFSTVQAGVDHVGRSTVNVGLGVFVEQVEIDKSLTLQGSGSGTVIQAPNTLTQYFTTGANKNYPIIYVHDADDVTIRDLAVDGAGKGNANYRFIGIAYHNAGGTVRNVEVFGIRDTPFSGAQHGVGIYAYNEDGTPRSLTISDSFIYDFQKNGMALLGNGLTVHVEGNTVVGVGPSGTIAQNGIQVMYGAGGLIYGNVVRDIWWTGPTWTASGILVGETAADLQIVGNEVQDAQTGIYAYNTTGQLLISYNNIAGGYWNVILYNTPGAVVQFNAITGSGDGSWTDSGPNATLNWWGSAGGPTVDEDEDGVFEYEGGGETLYGNFIYSPWLGTNPDGDPTQPGVQITGPVTIIVAPVGPEPTGGYLNTAIAGANTLPFADTIRVREGTYSASTPVTGPTSIVSCASCPNPATLTGTLALQAAGILIGRMGEGFTILGNVTVGAGVDASTIHINWNDIYGNVTNNGLGVLDATYNWWGGRHPSLATAGLVNYYPYLPLPVCEMLDYMASHGVDADTAIFLIERGGLIGEGLLVLSLVERFGLSREEAEKVVEDFGFLRVGCAFQRCADYDEFVRLLLGFGVASLGVAESYRVGEPIVLAYDLVDFMGNPVLGIGAWVTLIQIHEDGHQTIWRWGATKHNPETGKQEITLSTDGLPAGDYELVIGFKDCSHQTLRTRLLLQR